MHRTSTILASLALLGALGCGEDPEGPGTIGGGGDFDAVSDAGGTGSDAGGTASDAADAAEDDTAQSDTGSTGAADTGPADAGPADAGPADSGPADTGPADTGAADTGAADTGPADTGAADTGAADTGPADTGPADTGPADSGPADSGPADTGPADTGEADTGAPDAGTPDTGSPDAGSPDTGSKGKCDNTDDFKALAKIDPSKVISGCVTTCLVPGAACTACLKKGLGVSDGCTGCFADIVQCTVAKCALKCLSPTSKSCTDCQKANCFPAFVTCAGVSPP